MTHDEKHWQAELRRTGLLLFRAPEDARALLDRGVAAFHLEDWQMAVESMRKARLVVGDLPGLLRNLIRTYLKMRDPAAALTVAEQLLAGEGGGQEPENWALMGSVLMECGRLEEALSATRRCRALGGQDHSANSFNMANLLLALGQWQEGLPVYEGRWNFVDEPSRAMKHALSALPAWNPAVESRIDLIIGAEQGIGDMIMVARYLPLIAARVLSVTVTTVPPLLALLSRNFAHVPNLRFVPRDAITAGGEARHLMSMSILHAMDARPDNIPARDGYLSASHWAGYRRRSRARPAVGLAWKGSALHPADDLRSLPPQLVTSFIGQSPHVDFYALSPPSMSPLPGAVPANLHFLVQEGEGLEVTAALMEELDLIISVDSAPCHLAGALGLPVWTLLRPRRDWRWEPGDDGQTCWYSSMSLLCQPSPGDWAGLLDEVTGRLATLGMA